MVSIYISIVFDWAYPSEFDYKLNDMVRKAVGIPDMRDKCILQYSESSYIPAIVVLIASHFILSLFSTFMEPKNPAFKVMHSNFAEMKESGCAHKIMDWVKVGMGTAFGLVLVFGGINAGVLFGTAPLKENCVD